MLGKVFERFVEKAPVAVMVRGILERTVGSDALDALYERSIDKQYTRDLMFSSVFQLMNLVVCRIQPSIHAAYQDNKASIETSLTAVYDKLNGIDPITSRALVLDTAKEMAVSMREMKSSRTPWLPGYRVKVLDGNCIEATEHRLSVLRETGGGALPGKSLGHLRARARDGHRRIPMRRRACSRTLLAHCHIPHASCQGYSDYG
ncbi:MAG: hypothetical protein COB33_004745 [Thiotrichaceae bacterium]|nr:hypothetical protein [Thiotrichaceae bacterium]PCI10264.1 MAG: hypothetical protein COB71_13150 [Thiotrichales bacterium]